MCVGTLICQKSIFCSNVDLAYQLNTPIQVRWPCYWAHPLKQKRNILSRASTLGFDSPFSPNTCSQPKKKKKWWSVPQEERKNNTLISCTCKSWLLGKHPDCHLSLCWNEWHLAPVIFWSTWFPSEKLCMERERVVTSSEDFLRWRCNLRDWQKSSWRLRTESRYFSSLAFVLNLYRIFPSNTEERLLLFFFFFLL